MPQSQSNTNPPTNIPQMTPLSIAFPMTFEPANPKSTTDQAPPSIKISDPNRTPHRHDAGE